MFIRLKIRKGVSVRRTLRPSKYDWHFPAALFTKFMWLRQIWTKDFKEHKKKSHKKKKKNPEMKGVVNYQHSVSWILIKFSQQTLVQGKTRSKGDTTSISSQKKEKAIITEMIDVDFS